MWRPEADTGYFPLSLSTTGLRQGLSLILKLSESVRRAGQHAPKILPSLPSQLPVFGFKHVKSFKLPGVRTTCCGG